MTFPADEPMPAGSIAPPHDGAPPPGRTGEIVVSPAPKPPSRLLLALAPTLLAAAGLAMLWLGGAPAGFGAWLLAAGFPIVLGAVTRSPRLASLPAALWIAWFVAGQVVADHVEMPRTPLPLAITLAAVGIGATLLAQRAVAPALERAAWLPPQQRQAPTIDAALDPSEDAEFSADEAEVSELVAEAFDIDDQPAAEEPGGETGPDDENVVLATDGSGEHDDIVTTEELEQTAAEQTSSDG